MMRELRVIVSDCSFCPHQGRVALLQYRDANAMVQLCPNCARRALTAIHTGVTVAETPER